MHPCRFTSCTQTALCCDRPSNPGANSPAWRASDSPCGFRRKLPQGPCITKDQNLRAACKFFWGVSWLSRASAGFSRVGGKRRNFGAPFRWGLCGYWTGANRAPFFGCGFAAIRLCWQSDFCAVRCPLRGAKFSPTGKTRLFCLKCKRGHGIATRAKRRMPSGCCAQRPIRPC